VFTRWDDEKREGCASLIISRQLHSFCFWCHSSSLFGCFCLYSSTVFVKVNARQDDNIASVAMATHSRPNKLWLFLQLSNRLLFAIGWI
jgi:hypothetical protein